jgi:hypothetical protein
MRALAPRPDSEDEFERSVTVTLFEQLVATGSVELTIIGGSWRHDTMTAMLEESRDVLLATACAAAAAVVGHSCGSIVIEDRFELLTDLACGVKAPCDSSPSSSQYRSSSLVNDNR